jgi:Transposase DDE domain group 1
MNPSSQERPCTDEDQARQDRLLVDWIDDKPVLLDFEAGRLSSDAGVLLLGQLDAHLALTQAMASVLHDERDPKRTRHSMTDLLRQRVFQIAAGYEDQDDSDTLRSDPIFKMLLGRAPPAGADLASQPTMSRFENGITSYELDQLGTVFLEAFIGSYDEAPEVIVLDFDDTADLAHGEQEQARYNGHVGDHCFMPLHVYEGLSGRLILTMLKPSLLKGIDLLPILQRLVRRLRQAWPRVEILYRGDSHFTYPEVMAYLDSESCLHYVTGLGTNKVLKHLASEIEAEARRHYARGDRVKVLRFHSVYYQAGTWSHPRRVVIKVEVTEKGVNTRFIVTDLLQAPAQWLYRAVYCARGQMENYIKDHKRGLKSDRTSCHRFLANQFRLWLHSAAYVLLWMLRAEVLGRSSWSRVRFETLQLRLLKLAVCRRSRIRGCCTDMAPFNRVPMRLCRAQSGRPV